MSVKLFAIGDSLIQGFLNGSISQTHLSFPALIAQCLEDKDFNVPDFSGAGGLPINLEALLNHLASRYNGRIDKNDLDFQKLTIQQFIDEAEDYWERGEGAKPTTTGPLHRNVGVWGFQLPECDTLTSELCDRYILPAKDDLLNQLPESALYRTARRTLNPSWNCQYQSLTQLDVAQKIAEQEGGIDQQFQIPRYGHCETTRVMSRP